MYPYKAEEIIDCFSKAKNLNAAIKNFLKRDAKRGELSEKFAKEAKNVLVDRRGDSNTFVNFYMERSEPFLYALAGHAHMPIVTELAQSIVDRYADEFNSTYQAADGGIEVTNRARFNAIAKETLNSIDQVLSTNGFANSAFMKNVMLLSIFTQEVIPELMKNDN